MSCSLKPEKPVSLPVPVILNISRKYKHPLISWWRGVVVSVVRRMKDVALRWARLILGMGDRL